MGCGQSSPVTAQTPSNSRQSSIDSLPVGTTTQRAQPVPSERSLNRAKGNQRRINSGSTAESGFEDSDTGDEKPISSRQSSVESQRIRRKPPPPLPKRSSDELILPRVSTASSDLENPENLKPFKDPNGKLAEASRQMAVEDWESKCDGLTALRRLVAHHDNLLMSQLHPVTLSVAAEVKNLRSQVSRLAMVCLGDMYTYLKKNMDTDLELTVSVLLTKTGESNKFIREDAEKALVAMVENVTTIRALNALIAGGASSRNVAVRNITAQLLLSIVEIMGPNKVLREVPDKLLPVAARFVMDGSPDSRYSGQKILYLLMSSSPDEFERALSRHLDPSMLRNIQDKLDSLRKKGLGEPPSGSTSSRMRRVPSNSRVTRERSTESSDLSLPPPGPHTNSSKAPRIRVDDATMADLQASESRLGSTDWSERLGGVDQLVKFVSNKPDIARSQITRIFGKFVPCLHDTNSKVNLSALRAMARMTPTLSGSMSSVLGHTVQTIASNLASKNTEIQEAASAVFDVFMENIDPAQLLQPFISEAQKSKGQVKVDMTERITYLIMQVYESKPTQVSSVALPYLWHLLAAVLNSMSAPRLRSVTSNLVTMLYRYLGQDLLLAACNSAVTPTMHDLLNDILDGAAA